MTDSDHEIIARAAKRAGEESLQKTQEFIEKHSQPRVDPLEACAREIVREAFGEYPAAFAATEAVLAIMRRHELRVPEEVQRLERQLAEARETIQRIRDSLSGELPAPSWKDDLIERAQVRATRTEEPNA